MEARVYRGIRFRLYEGRRYFTPGHADRRDGVEDLHREVWKHERGPIPPGFHVHHIDLDPTNNDVANLACLTPAEHEAVHAADRSVLGLSAEHQAHLATIRHLAAAWHGSPAGIAWHVEHGKATWAGREPEHVGTCEQCGAEYRGFFDGRFCSNACKSAWRRATGADNETRVCAQCGAAFTTNRHKPARTCSKSCGAKMRWAVQRQ